MGFISQDDHSDVRKRRRKWPKTAKKRRFTGVMFTLFHRNPSFQITATVNGRFLSVYRRLRAVLFGLGD
jgi:hypothetical protein